MRHGGRMRMKHESNENNMRWMTLHSHRAYYGAAEGIKAIQQLQKNVVEISRTSERNSPNCVLWAIIIIFNYCYYCHERIPCSMKMAEKRCAIVHINAEFPSIFTPFSHLRCLRHPMHCVCLPMAKVCEWAFPLHNIFTWRKQNETKRSRVAKGCCAAKKNENVAENEMRRGKKRRGERKSVVNAF